MARPKKNTPKTPPKPKLPPARDFVNRQISDWNTMTFQAYINHLHETKFGIPYTPKYGYAKDGGMIKNFIEDIGNLHAKEFFDECFKVHKVSDQYPVLTVDFMYVYMRPKLLPQLQRKQVQQQTQQAFQQQQPKLSVDEMIDLL